METALSERVVLLGRRLFIICLFDFLKWFYYARYIGDGEKEGYSVRFYSKYVCVCVVIVKDFLRTAYLRILKFNTNIGCEKLYCVLENQTPTAYHSLYLSIFLSLN